jgi:4-hydroxy 2-oxovalerate aldolase
MKLLDCTLRDGGYYTNWDFSDKLVDVYIESFNQLPVEYLEIGYRSVPLKGYYGEYFYCPLYVLEKLKRKTHKKLVVILNEKDTPASAAEELLNPVLPYIDMVRLAVDPENFVRALALGKEVKRLGFEVSFNVMYMSNWKKHHELMSNLHQLNGWADYLYMVDSFGGVYPEDIVSTIQIIREHTSVPLGFHGHNNLELGLINTLTALENGVEIVDATVTGMGRGAGNLKTELLLSVLNAKNKLEFDYNPLSKVTDAFTKLQDEYGWGTNLPYMVSGANSLPQKQVMEWVSKRFYSFNSILRALTNQSKGVKDNYKLSAFEPTKGKKYSTALVVGGGPSVVEHATALGHYLTGNPDVLIIHASSRNARCFDHLPNDQLFCLVGNEGHRLEEVFGSADQVKGLCVLPPFPRKMGTYIPDALKDRAYELPSIDFVQQLTDTHTALALQTAISFGFKEVLVTGYDGYAGNSISQKEQDFFIENEYLFLHAQKAGLRSISITPTRYQNLEQDSLFARV